MRTRKNKIIIAMCIAVLFMATGYALLSSQLNIRGISKLTDTWDIRITYVEGVPTGRAYNLAEPTFTDTSMTFKVGVKEPGDKMLFTVRVDNYGTLDAVLDEINATATGNDKIVYTISGIQEGTRLLAGSSITFYITTEFDINATELPTDPIKDLVVELVYIQDDGQTLTPSNPSIDEDYTYGSLSSVVLLNNTALPDTSIDFSKHNTYASSYSQKNSLSPSKITFSSSSTYYYGTSYTFDSATGYYKLAGSTTSGKWSAMSSSFKTYPYTCMSTSSTGTCANLRKMIGYTNSTTGLGYSYTRTINFADNGNGLFYTSTNTENSKPTYYFRGKVDNNYVKFGKYEQDYIKYRGYLSTTYIGTQDFKEYSALAECQTASSYNVGCVATTIAEAGDDILWRIVRINEDGSIRLITDDVVGTKQYNYSATDNAHVGYMYGTAGSSSYADTHANVYSSGAKDFLDDWYTKSLKNSYGKYLADAGFCNDRSLASASGSWNASDTALGYGTNATYYGAYNRINNLQHPQFKCPNESNDLFTTSTATKGNNKLTNPIGLLTSDEVIYGGIGAASTSIYDSSIFTSYLLKSWSDSLSMYHQYWWTMTPYYTYSSTNSSTGVVTLSPYMYSWTYMGTVTTSIPNSTFGVRPVVNVKGTIGVVDGKGTLDDPYILDVE